LTVGIALVAMLPALGNLFPVLPMVLIWKPDGQSFSRSEFESIRSTLQGVNLGFANDDQRAEIVIAFDSTIVANAAVDVLRQLPNSTQTALQFAPNMPGWISSLGIHPLRPGLGLGHSIEMRYQIDYASGFAAHLRQLARSAEQSLREAQIFATVQVAENGLRVIADTSPSNRIVRGLDVDGRVTAMLTNLVSDTVIEQRTGDGWQEFQVRLSDEDIDRWRNAAIRKNIALIRGSLSAFGVGEVSIEQIEKEILRIRMADVRESLRLQQFLQSQSIMEVRVGHFTDELPEYADERIPESKNSRINLRDGSVVIVEADAIVSGADVSEVFLRSYSESTSVEIRLSEAGARRMYEATRNHVGQPVVRLMREESSIQTPRRAILDSDLVPGFTATDIAIVREPLSSPIWATGLTYSEASDLTLRMRAAAFSAAMEKVDERFIPPGIASDAVLPRNIGSVIALIVSGALVFRYFIFGGVIIVALSVHQLMVVGVLSALQVTMTMESLAGIPLGAIALLVSCIWIAERIRGELANGNTILASIRWGYRQSARPIIGGNGVLFCVALLSGLISGPPLDKLFLVVCLSCGLAPFVALGVTRVIVSFMEGSGRSRVLFGLQELTHA